MSIHHTWFFALYTPMPIAVTGPGCFNKTEPAALESDKGSDEPDPCA